MAAKKKKEKQYILCNDANIEDLNTHLNEILRIFYTLRAEIDAIRGYIKTSAEINKEKRG
jgi:hypothetical protein